MVSHKTTSGAILRKGKEKDDTMTSSYKCLYANARGEKLQSRIKLQNIRARRHTQRERERYTPNI